MRHSDLTFGRVNFTARRVGMRFGNGTSVAGDTEAPTISTVVGPANDTYVAGENLDFVATFTEAVTVTGTPRIALDIGGVTRYANYLSGSGTDELTFRYQVQSGDNDSNGIGCTSPIDLNSGSISDAAANAATLTFTPPTLTSVKVDAVAPTVSSASFSNQPGDTYDSSVGTLNLDVVFNEAATVTGTPQFTIDADTAADGFPKVLNYTSGSGTTTLRFAYAVDSLDDSGSSDLNAPSTSALALNGGTIKDQYGNNATLTLPAGLTVKIGGNDGQGIQITPG